MAQHRRPIVATEVAAGVAAVEKILGFVLDSAMGAWQYIPCVAALPQLDRGSDYESERHRFESCTPHQSNLRAPGNGGFSFVAPLLQHEFVAE